MISLASYKSGVKKQVCMLINLGILFNYEWFQKITETTPKRLLFSFRKYLYLPHGRYVDSTHPSGNYNKVLVSQNPPPPGNWKMEDGRWKFSDIM